MILNNFSDLGIQSTEESASNVRSTNGNGIEQIEFHEEGTENGCNDDVEDDEDDDKAHLAIRFSPQDKTICMFIYLYRRLEMKYM